MDTTFWEKTLRKIKHLKSLALLRSYSSTLISRTTNNENPVLDEITKISPNVPIDIARSQKLVAQRINEFEKKFPLKVGEENFNDLIVDQKVTTYLSNSYL